MAQYILSFNSISKTDIPIAGGKGANLGEMTNAGIPVPDGCVLSADAYDLFIDSNGIDILKELKAGVSEKEVSERIRSRICAAEMPAETEREIRRFYKSLGEGARVAVRSSATAEDLSDASFAGQQDTYLNVMSEEKLLSRIKDCYASLWGERAIHYRNASGYGGRKVSIAVVIQKMVESESAGVIFTQSPSGDGKDILINASYGLGEAVVSGMVTPDEYVCGRDGEVKGIAIGSKEMKIVYGEEGTARVPVSKEEREGRVLEDDMIYALVDHALRIESHYGRPMDIEWAIKDGKVYILQARAITAIPGISAPVFSDREFEGLPVVKTAKGRMRKNVLFNLEKLPKPYHPLDHDFGNAVGRQKEKLIAEIGIRMNEMTPIDNDGISHFSLGGMRPTGRIVKIPGFIRQMKDCIHNMKTSTDELNACMKAYQKECARKSTTIQELGESLSRMKGIIERTAYSRFRYAIFPQLLENRWLSKVLARIDRNLNAFDLLEGLSYVTADINRGMEVICQEIRKDAKQKEAVMTLPYSQITALYPALAKQIGLFMERFGNRSDLNCYCFSARSWNEEPDRFLHSLRAMLRTMPEANDSGIPTIEEGGLRFENLMSRARNAIGERRYHRFKQKVDAVRHYHTVRESTQYLWESEFAHCRKLLHQVADRLGESYSDLMFLFADELFDACGKGYLDPKKRESIGRRQDSRPLAEAYWSRSIGIMLGTGTSEIRGVCGSGGKATGKACIVKNHWEFGKLDAGDVLVCPYTDPEWTPLFTLASGVVVDTGGTLSHAAIVAREYHIPAVLATGNATERIREGDNVLVDGDIGKVLVIS